MVSFVSFVQSYQVAATDRSDYAGTVRLIIEVNHICTFGHDTYCDNVVCTPAISITSCNSTIML